VPALTADQALTEAAPAVAGAAAIDVATGELRLRASAAAAR
jgi:hypothetical protein